MSTAASSILVFALYLVLAAPLLWGLFNGKLASSLGVFYLAITAGVAAYHLEFAAPDLPPMVRPAAVLEEVATDPRCAKALDLSEQAGLVLERGDSTRLVVDEALWAQTPEEVRDALVACHGATGPAGVVPQVIERAGPAAR